MDDLKAYQDLAEKVKSIFEQGLQANPGKEIFQIGEEQQLWVSRKEAERMMTFIRKLEKTKTIEESKELVKKEYDKIPYIIGLSPESGVLGEFQDHIEEMSRD